MWQTSYKLTQQKLTCEMSCETWQMSCEAIEHRSCSRRGSRRCGGDVGVAFDEIGSCMVAVDVACSGDVGVAFDEIGSCVVAVVGVQFENGHL